jgi:hypothetical protein
MAAPFAPDPEPGRGGGALVSWAEQTTRWDRPAGRGMVRFVFYGRVSIEDWQDPVTSRVRQREQAEALVRGRHPHPVHQRRHPPGRLRPAYPAGRAGRKDIPGA